MTREEMEALVRAVTLEVLKELKRSTAPVSADSNGSGCAGGCGHCNGTGAVESRRASPKHFTGRVLTEAALESLASDGHSLLKLRAGTIVTPLARDLAAEMQIRLECEREEGSEVAGASNVPPIQCPTNSVAFFSARGSLTHERIVSAAAEKAGFEVRRCTPGERNGRTAAALSCARLVSQGQCCRGVIVSDEIYTVLRQVNRLSGIKAEVCRDVERARESRRSETNLILLSDGQMGMKMLERILEAWLSR